MPINIASTLPARKVLDDENISVITDERASVQDIRPLRIIILNLMPKKIETETQLLRLLSNSPLQVDIDLLQVSSHISKNTNAEHLLKFYKNFDDVKTLKYDGLIITGAPVELLDFEDVDYYDELKLIMEWSKTNVYSTYHICWGSQVGLYYHYGINKKELTEKMFGIYPHIVTDVNDILVRGFDELYYVPHSRHTGLDEDAVYKNPKLKVLSYSYLSGLNLITSCEGHHVFVCGHCEYDRDTLAKEYFRDLEKGDNIQIPFNYFPDDDPTQVPYFIWRAHANLLIKNWLNLVYQQTPYNLDDLEPLVV
ncbi:MAG: homoserine O-succinyltransferase [Erysipelotrichaceae bacterium]